MRSERRNFYRILHLQPDASPEVVKANFRTLMQKLKMHPDLGGDHWDAALVAEAYSTLSNPTTRAQYDVELLARYDLIEVSAGEADAKRRAMPGQNRERHGNRRNFYRLLKVQHDAPQEIVDAALVTARSAKSLDPRILEDAERILCDIGRRATYDSARPRVGHASAAAIALDPNVDMPDHSDEEAPRISRYCHFCKTPSPPHDAAYRAHCRECASPLTAPPDALANLARRALARVERNDPVEVFSYWPSTPTAAHLVDLSPTGLRLRSGDDIAVSDILKVDGHAFCAVGAVAHRTRDNSGATIGLKLHAVEFRESLGSFVATRV